MYTMAPLDVPHPACFHHALVALDDSQAAKDAFETVLPLVGALGGRLTILSVTEPSAVEAACAQTIGYLGATVARDSERSSRAVLDAALERTGAAGIDATTLWEVGEVVETILSVAERVGADAIVMGTHGRSGLAHVLVGSTAEAVLRRSNLPVMLVRNPRRAGVEL